MNETYGHTPASKMFTLGDVYGVGFDAERAAQKPFRLGVIGMGGVAQSKYLPAVARLRTLGEPVETLLFDEEWGGCGASELSVASHRSMARGTTVELPLDPATADAELSAGLTHSRRGVQ